MMVRAEGRPSGSVALPVVSARIDDHALHRRRGVVAFLPRGLAVVVLRDDHAPAVRVEQDLGGVEPQSALAGPTAPRPGSRRAVPAARLARTRASSGRCGSLPDRSGPRGTGVASSSRSKNSSSTPVAVRENRLKLTPPSTTVAPRGELRPIVSAWSWRTLVSVSAIVDDVDPSFVRTPDRSAHGGIDSLRGWLTWFHRADDRLVPVLVLEAEHADAGRAAEEKSSRRPAAGRASGPRSSG